MDDMELTMKRGQLLEETRGKSETLVANSAMMRKRSREVKVRMCCRKWIYYIAGVGVAIALVLLLYFLFK